MTAESIVTGIITGVFTGGITGYLAALYAMRQFKAQRAFDKQLEWYERTIRALGQYSTLNREMTRVVEFGNPNLTFKTWQEFQKGLADLEQCINEAVLYAEQQSYEQLITMGAKYEEIKNKGDPKAAAREFALVNRVLHETLVEVSKPIRKKLGLKKIELK